MTAKILPFPQGTELQKARARMGGDEALYLAFRKQMELGAATDADFPVAPDFVVNEGPAFDPDVLALRPDLEPIDPEDLVEVLADFDG